MKYRKCSKCGLTYPATTEYFYRKTPTRLMGVCRHCWNVRRRAYYCANREREWATIKRYAEAHPDEVREWKRAGVARFRENNPERAREITKRAVKKRYADPKNRVSKNISTGMRDSLRREKNGYHWENLVGFTIDDLTAHLEAQFSKDMTWDNYGEWHIDHIRPVKDFNFTSPADPEFKACWSLWNLQPMWAKENISKGARCHAPPLPLN